MEMEKCCQKLWPEAWRIVVIFSRNACPGPETDPVDRIAFRLEIGIHPDLAAAGAGLSVMFPRGKKHSNYTDSDTLSRYVDILLDNAEEKNEKKEYLKEIMHGVK